MNEKYNRWITAVRKFNRFYTNILGLLDQHMLNSEFSLSEARVLYEIGHQENCTAKKLIEGLRIDSGYLSRMVKRFEKNRLTYRVQSSEDGRSYYLYLTELGKEKLSQLDALSSRQIGQIIGSLQESSQKKLVEGMEAIEGVLSGNAETFKNKVDLRSGLKPGDVGQLIHLHGWIYAMECGYNHGFEAYVCKTFQTFLENYHPDKDRLWFAEAEGRMVGAIGIVGHSPKRAQLRWFILHPDFRGMGLGSRLLNEALLYCREKEYDEIFLETTQDQITAIAMYVKAGFRKVGERAGHGWGKDLVEETYELKGFLPSEAEACFLSVD